MQKIISKKFDLPKKLMDDLYEATGAGDRYKGFVLVVCDEKGNPMVCTNSEANVVHFGLMKALELHIMEEGN